MQNKDPVGVTMKSRWSWTATLALAGCLVAVVYAQERPLTEVTFPDIAAGFKDGSRWLTYSGDYSGQRHSPLTQITPANVRQLAAQWTFQTELPGKFETSSLLIDGVLYVTGLTNRAWALDAKTGRELWRYQRRLPADVVACCGLVNRGFAALGRSFFMA